MSNLFEVDPVTNEVVYNQEQESMSDGNNDNQTGVEGSVLQPEASDPAQVQENETLGVADLGSSDTGIMLLSEDDIAALAINAPAAGSLNSSTIDYFDRLVDGLPTDYGYVAYRFDVDDAYAGTIIYGDDYETNDTSIVFGEGAVQIDVSRVTGTGYASYIQYERFDASNSVISVSQSGNILYYTNAFDGYPILGSGARPFEIGPFLTVGIVSAFAAAVLNKLLNRRRKHD